MTPSPDDLGTPGSYITLEEGTPVFSSDGEELGRVDEVRADLGTDVFDGLVIGAGALGGDRRFVEGAKVEEIYERGVVLKLDAAVARDFPRPEDAAGGP
ncbi:MAG: PRC-barrel domain-containing protein [Solirubrobacterales bacterium]